MLKNTKKIPFFKKKMPKWLMKLKERLNSQLLLFV